MKQTLKLTNLNKLAEIQQKYNLEIEADCDCLEGWSYALAYKGGVFIDLSTGYIEGIEASDLTLLYDLIKDGVVKKEVVGNEI